MYGLLVHDTYMSPILLGPVSSILWNPLRGSHLVQMAAPGSAWTLGAGHCCTVGLQGHAGQQGNSVTGHSKEWLAGWCSGEAWKMHIGEDVI